MRIFVTGLFLLALLGGMTCLSSVRADEEDEAPLDDSADGEVPFGDQVNIAIDRGVKWLLQRPDVWKTGNMEMAHWGLIVGNTFYGGGQGEGYKHPAGCTALALYTLLKCGVDPEHPRIVQGFNWLNKTHPIHAKYDDIKGNVVGWPWSYRIPLESYQLSANILALCAKYDRYKRTKNTKKLRKRRGGKIQIRDKADRAWLEQMAQALVGRRGIPSTSTSRSDRLGWRYNMKGTTLTRGKSTSTFPEPPAPPHANQDLSSTQFAALALFSAHQLGVSVDEDVWADIVHFTLSHQEAQGPDHSRPAESYPGGSPPVDKARGFMYIKGSPDNTEGKATGSMTMCGVANLLMAKDVLLESKDGRKVWEQQGFKERVDRAVWDGLAWLDLHWSSFKNPVRNLYHTYYLYAIERAMDLLGKQLVGKHVWYNEGAMELLNRQRPKELKDPSNPDAEPVQGGYWETGTTHKPFDVLDTCFALLFLKRSTKGMIPVTGGDHGARDGR